MALQIEGTVYFIGQLKTGEGKNGQWQRKDFAIETKETYPKKIAFQAWKDKTDEVNKLKTGQNIKVFFNPESSQSAKDSEQWFTNNQLWKIELIQSVPINSQPANPTQKNTVITAEQTNENPFEESTGLPF